MNTTAHDVPNNGATKGFANIKGDNSTADVFTKIGIDLNLKFGDIDDSNRRSDHGDEKLFMHEIDPFDTDDVPLRIDTERVPVAAPSAGGSRDIVQSPSEMQIESQVHGGSTACMISHGEGHTAEILVRAQQTTESRSSEQCMKLQAGNASAVDVGGMPTRTQKELQKRCEPVLESENGYKSPSSGNNDTGFTHLTWWEHGLEQQRVVANNEVKEYPGDAQHRPPNDDEMREMHEFVNGRISDKDVIDMVVDADPMDVEKIPQEAIYAPFAGAGVGKGGNISPKSPRLPDEVWYAERTRVNANVIQYYNEYGGNWPNMGDLMNYINIDSRFREEFIHMGIRFGDYTSSAKFENGIGPSKLPRTVSIMALESHLLAIQAVQLVITTIEEAHSEEKGFNIEKRVEHTRLKFLNEQINSLLRMTQTFENIVIKDHMVGGVDNHDHPLLTFCKSEEYALLMNSSERHETIQRRYKEKYKNMLSANSHDSTAMGNGIECELGECYKVDDPGDAPSVRDAKRECNSILEEYIPPNNKSLMNERQTRWYRARDMINVAMDNVQYEKAMETERVEELRKMIEDANASYNTMFKTLQVAIGRADAAQKALSYHDKDKYETLKKEQTRLEVENRLRLSPQAKSSLEESSRKIASDIDLFRSLLYESTVAIADQLRARGNLEAIQAKKYTLKCQRDTIKQRIYHENRTRGNGKTTGSTTRNQDLDNQASATGIDGHQRHAQSCNQVLDRVRSHFEEYKTLHISKDVLSKLKRVYEDKQLALVNAEYISRRDILQNQVDAIDKEISEIGKASGAPSPSAQQLTINLQNARDALRQCIRTIGVVTVPYDNGVATIDTIYKHNERCLVLDAQKKAAKQVYDAWKANTYDNRIALLDVEYGMFLKYQSVYQHEMAALQGMEAEIIYKNANGVTLEDGYEERVHNLKLEVDRKRTDIEGRIERVPEWGKTRSEVFEMADGLRRECKERYAKTELCDAEMHLLLTKQQDIERLIQSTIQSNVHTHETAVEQAQQALSNKNAEISERIQKILKTESQLSIRQGLIETHRSDIATVRKENRDYKTQSTHPLIIDKMKTIEDLNADITKARRMLLRYNNELNTMESNDGQDTEHVNPSRMVFLSQEKVKLEQARAEADTIRFNALSKFFVASEKINASRSRTHGRERTNESFLTLDVQKGGAILQDAPEFYSELKACVQRRCNVMKLISTGLQQLYANECDDMVVKELEETLLAAGAVTKGQCARMLIAKPVDIKLTNMKNARPYTDKIKEAGAIAPEESRGVMKKFLNRPAHIGKSDEEYLQEVMALLIADISDLARAGSGRARHYYSIICGIYQEVINLEDAEQLDIKTRGLNGKPRSVIKMNVDGVVDCEKPTYEEGLSIALFDVMNNGSFEVKFLYTRLQNILQTWEAVIPEQRGGAWPNPLIAKDLADNALPDAQGQQPKIDDDTGEVVFMSNADKIAKDANDYIGNLTSTSTLFRRSVVPWVNLTENGHDLPVPVDSDGKIIRQGLGDNETHGWCLDLPVGHMVYKDYERDIKAYNEAHGQYPDKRNAATIWSSAYANMARVCSFTPTTDTFDRLCGEKNIHTIHYISRDPTVSDFIGDEAVKTAISTQNIRMEVYEKDIKTMQAIVDDINKEIYQLQIEISKDGKGGNATQVSVGVFLGSVTAAREDSLHSSSASGIGDMWIDNPRTDSLSIARNDKLVLLKQLLSAWTRDISRRKAYINEVSHGRYAYASGIHVDGRVVNMATNDCDSSIDYLENNSWTTNNDTVESVVSILNIWIVHYYGPFVNPIANLSDFNDRVKPWLTNLKANHLLEWPDINFPSVTLKSPLKSEFSTCRLGRCDRMDTMVDQSWSLAHPYWNYTGRVRQHEGGGGLPRPPIPNTRSSPGKPRIAQFFSHVTMKPPRKPRYEQIFEANTNKDDHGASKRGTKRSVPTQFELDARDHADAFKRMDATRQRDTIHRRLEYIAQQQSVCVQQEPIKSLIRNSIDKHSSINVSDGLKRAQLMAYASAVAACQVGVQASSDMKNPYDFDIQQFKQVNISVSWNRDVAAPELPNFYNGAMENVPENLIDYVIEALAADKADQREFSILLHYNDTPGNFNVTRLIILDKNPPEYSKQSSACVINKKYTNITDERRRLLAIYQWDTKRIDLRPFDATPLPSEDEDDDDEDDDEEDDDDEDDDDEDDDDEDDDEEDDDEEDDAGGGIRSTLTPVLYFGSFDPGNIRVPIDVAGIPIKPTPFLQLL